MASKQDLYAVLGVAKTASEDEIKKGYKKSALQHHPDRNPNNKEAATIKFQEVNKAFNTLNDPEKRARYDKFGVVDGENNESGGMPGGFNPFEMFSNMFGAQGNGMPGFNMNGNMNNDSRRNAKSPDKKITINISLTDVYKGKVIPIDFNKLICCDKCDGCGAISKDSIKSCNVCNGKGKIVRMMQMGPMIQQSIQNCTSCAGIGKVIPSGSNCTKCNGQKCMSMKRHVDCYIRPGTTQGSNITFKNESDWVSDFGDVGDLIVFINCKSEEGIFHREADNLIMKKSITLLEALTNTTFYIKHLDDRVIKITYEDIIKPGQKMIIKSEGIPNLQDNLHKGNLIIHFEIIFPTSATLEKERAKYLFKILPHPHKQIWDMQLEKTPESELTTYTLEHFSDEYKNGNGNGNGNGNSKIHPDIDELDEDVFSQFNNAKGGIPMNPVECATQ
jgi:DnaJ-class molecular chaperone